MELKTAIEILEYHQEWRLGKREDMIHEPKKLTQALDIVLNEVKKLEAIKSEFVTELQNSYAKEHIRYQIIHKGTGIPYNSILYMSKDNAELDCLNDDYAASVLFIT